LYEVAQLGAVIAPPMPAFYNQPATIDDLINHSVGRVLDLFGIDTGAVKRWQGSLKSTGADPIPANVSDMKEHK
jgi:4-hydroxy-3-polyprenylbenzoate decarboxylase